MSIEAFIAEKTQQKSETELVSVRLPSSTVSIADELCSSLSTVRQELLAKVLVDGINDAVRVYQKFMQKNADLYDQPIENDDDENARPRYVFLNTNMANDPSDHDYMVSNGIAAAFYGDWKNKIDTLKKGDVVFLYQSGKGIVGTGKASGETETLDKDGNIGEMHQQKLINYQKVGPLSAKEIKKLTGTNLRFLQVMFKVKAAHGAAIERHLKGEPPLTEEENDIFYRDVVSAIDKLYSLSFPEYLFRLMHHKSDTLSSFKKYALGGIQGGVENPKCKWDSNNGRNCRRIAYLLDHYNGQATETEWQELVEKSVQAIPFKE